MSTSIHPRGRKYKTAQRRKANSIRNRQARAALYKAHNGSSNWQRDVNGWHTTIEALRRGTI